MAKWWVHVSDLKRTRGKIARLSYRPSLEPLEKRALLSIDYWTGLGGTNNWSNPANWHAGIAPALGDDLSFGTRGSLITINDFAPRTNFHTIYLNGIVTIQGNGIVLTGGIRGDQSRAVINLDKITLSNDQTFTGGFDVYSPIDCNGFALSLAPYSPGPGYTPFPGRTFGTIYPGTLHGADWSVLGPIFLTTNAFIDGVGPFKGSISLNGFSLTLGGGTFDGGIIGTERTESVSIAPAAATSIFGNDTCPGPTTISGTLSAIASITGPVTVQAGGSLEAIAESPLMPLPGTLTTGPLTLESGSNLSVFLQNSTDYSQVLVNGPINLNGSHLNLHFSNSFGFNSGISIVILQSTDSIIGTFSGLADGSILFFGSEPFHIHYYNAGPGTPGRVVLSNEQQWRDVLTGDFDGDGKPDIAGRNFAGQWFVSLSTGSGFTSTSYAWTTWNEGAGWQDVQVGDFNGDGKADIAGRTVSGDWWVAISDGSSFTNSFWGHWNPNVIWVDVKVGDFNGDGKADIVGRWLQAGQWWMAQSTGSSFTNSLWGNWNPAATFVDVQAADFDGDKKTDLTARWLQGGSWWTALSTGSSFNTSMWASWNPAGTFVDVKAGDFNGDGKADITGRWLQGGSWWTAISTGSSFVTTLWAAWNPNVTWVDVQVGDFNGDGKADITGRWLQGGQWWTATSTGSSFTTNLWASWNPNVTWVDSLTADFTGDGKSDLTSRYQAGGQWWSATSSGSDFATSLWTTWPV
jgi:hypothetical protein